MAKDGMGSIIGLAAGAGILWYAYESGWLSAFGLGPTVASALPTPVPAAAAAAPVATAGSGAGTAPATPSGPCPLTGVLSPALALAQKQQGWGDPNAPGSVLNMDQWNYFLGQVCTGLAAQLGDKLDPAAVFPGDANRGGPLNWLAYKGYATAAGLSGLRRIAASGMGTRLVRKGVACC